MRKARSIDRQAIKDTLYPGSLVQLADSPLPPGYFGHMPVAMPEYDPEQAKKLLAEAGHPNGFTIKGYFISKSFAFPKVMTLVQEQLKKVGINVDMQLVEHPTYHEAQQRIMRAAICGPIVDVPFLQPRNPKRMQAPFDPEYGEFSLHFNYNYPEMLKILD